MKFDPSQLMFKVHKSNVLMLGLHVDGASLQRLFEKVRAHTIDAFVTLHHAPLVRTARKFVGINPQGVVLAKHILFDSICSPNLYSLYELFWIILFAEDYGMVTGVHGICHICVQNLSHTLLYSPSPQKNGDPNFYFLLLHRA